MSIKMFLKSCILKEILVEIKKTNCRETMEKRNLKREKKEKTLKWGFRKVFNFSGRIPKAANITPEVGEKGMLDNAYEKAEH